MPANCNVALPAACLLTAGLAAANACHEYGGTFSPAHAVLLLLSSIT